MGHQGDDAAGAGGEVYGETGGVEAGGFGGGPVNEIAGGAYLGGFDESQGDMASGEHRGPFAGAGD